MKDKTDEYKNIQSPAWLVPPQKPNRNLPPMERKSATAAVLPRPHGVPIMRLAQKKFDKEEWKEAIDSLRKNPNLRIKIGAPHPEVEGLFFIQYNRQYVGGEYWGTKQRLSDFRKANNISSQKSRKKRMERDPEFKAKVMANLDRLIARKESLSEAEREQMDKEAARRWQARNNPNGEYSRRYYQANKMRIAKAQKARRRKVKEEKEQSLISALTKFPLYYLKKPDGRKAKPTREQRMAANAKKHQEKKERAAARKAAKAALAEGGEAA